MNTSYSQINGVDSAADAINPVRALAHSPGFVLFVMAIFHPLLALAMRTSSLLATVHAVGTITLGLVFALFGKDVRKVTSVAAYIAGAEVLWRMTNAHIFWEAGKYSMILILGICLVRIKAWQRIGSPILYFLLLSLSIPLTFSAMGFSGSTRDALSFNLSGPLALMLCGLYFSQITLDGDDIRALVWWLTLPILGIATLALYGTLSAIRIAFMDESNFATSGGFGPNQVSALLGLGSGLLLLLSFTGKGLVGRLLTTLLALALLSLSILTFSRGGIYNAAIMITLAFVHSLRSPRGRVTALVAVLVIGLVGGYYVFPRLNSFTGGMLQERFNSLDTTLRAQIARADIQLWLSHPLLGVGPGVSKTDRISIIGSGIAAHTEYTRILAEHGLAGILALLVLLWIAWRAYSHAPTVGSQTWVAALLAWPLMEMSHAAMRVVAISFLFGLAMVNWKAEESKSQED